MAPGPDGGPPRQRGNEVAVRDRAANLAAMLRPSIAYELISATAPEDIYLTPAEQ